MYTRTTEQVKDKEDTFSGLLTDLNLIHEEKKSNSIYSIPNESRNKGFLFCINTKIYFKFIKIYLITFQLFINSNVTIFAK